MSWPVLAGDQADVEADETVGVAVVVEEDTVAVDPEDTAVAAAAEAEGTATQVVARGITVKDKTLIYNLKEKKLRRSAMLSR